MKKVQGENYGISQKSDCSDQNSMDDQKRSEAVWDLEMKHSRFQDKKLYDFMLTQLLDIVNLLIQIYPKEVIDRFSKDVDLSQHLFFSRNESLH